MIYTSNGKCRDVLSTQDGYERIEVRILMGPAPQSVHLSAVSHADGASLLWALFFPPVSRTAPARCEYTCIVGLTSRGFGGSNWSREH